MQLTYTTQGTCARFIDIELEGETVRSVRFIGGCHGNLQAISRLVAGQPVQQLVGQLAGIICRNGTSCCDQLARALAESRLSVAS